MNTLFEAIIPIVAANGYGKEVISSLSVNKYLHTHPYLLHAIFKIKSTHYPWTGDTLLHRYAKQGCAQRMKDFINAGVNLEIRNYNGDTPLLCVVRHISPDKARYYEILQLLLDNGANPAAEGTFTNVLSTAVTFEDPTVVELLCKAGAPLNTISDYNGKNLLSLMTGNRQARMRYSPLAEAVLRNQLEIVRILVEYGANLNNVCFDKSTTLLCLAAKYNHVAIMQYLLELGVDSNEQSEHGTALHVATRNNRLMAIEILLKYGANVNATDKYNTTALMIAAVENLSPIVKYLVNNGADTTIVQNGTNRTALEIADVNKHWIIVGYLLKRSMGTENS